MWNKLGNINDLSLLAKVLCFILFLVTIIFITNIYIIGAIVLLFIILSIIIKNKILFVSTLVTIIIYILSFTSINTLLYLKIALVLNHIILILVLTKKEDLKAIYHNVFYRPKDFKHVVIYLRELYFKDKYRKNMQVLKEVSDNMGLDKNTTYYRNLSAKVTDKTNKDINELIEINYLRFFSVPKKRQKLEKKEWLEIDNTFLVIHILFLVLAIIYRS